MYFISSCDANFLAQAKIYFPLAHQLPQEALSSGANAQESLLDVLLGYIKLANGGGRGRESESGAGRGGGWSGLNPHAEETAQLALHMLNMTSSLLAVHGSTEWEQVTQLGSLDGMLAVLALVRVHSHPILNPPLVLRGLKVLVAVLETAPEARATAAQLVFSRTHNDMNLCELIVVMLASAVDALGSIGRAHAREASGLGDAAGGDSLALVVVSESVGEDPYHKYLNVLYVTFQLVESVCRGESHALKTYLRHQGDHLRSYDVLKGTVQALRQLEQLVLVCLLLPPSILPLFSYFFFFFCFLQTGSQREYGVWINGAWAVLSYHSSHSDRRPHQSSCRGGHACGYSCMQSIAALRL